MTQATQVEGGGSQTTRVAGTTGVTGNSRGRRGRSRGGTEPVDGYTFFYGSGNATKHLGQRSPNCGRLLCNNNMKLHC
jgi:hypothetical protein